MAIKLGDAIVFLRGDTGPLKKDLDAGQKETKAWTVAVGTMAGNLLSGAITGGLKLATSAASSLGKQLLFLAMDAAQIEGTSNTFGRLAESVGGEAAVAMEQLRVATRGMVADADLMQAGNKFLAMGLADTTEGAAKLAEMATQLGTAMGEDATASMENFALMMANQSLPRLDSFGVSSGKVRERIEELQAATEGMTREAAFNQAVMEQAAITMEKVGEQSGTAASKIAGMQATFANLKLQAGQALQPIMDFFVNLASGLVSEWGPWIQEWIGWIQISMEYLAEALQALVDGDFAGFLGGLSEALRYLGFSEETVTKIIDVINTLHSAFQDLKDGNIEEFIGKIKAVLLELGIPIGIIDSMEAAFRWLLKAWEDVQAFWVDKLKPALDELWITTLKPALEGLWSLLKELEPLLPVIGAFVATWIVAPFLLAAAPVLALGAALVALGLIWQEHSDKVKEIVTGLRDLITILFGEIGQRIQEAWQDFANIQLPWWLTPGSPTPLEMGLKGITGAMVDLRRIGAPVFSGMGNQDNRRNLTNYGGVQIYQQPGGGNPLEQLWELGTV
jgi:hypothetical protein